MNDMEKEIIEVSLDSIIPNRFQPRLTFDEQGLNELAKSIRQHGIIQPLVLRKIGNKYEIIAGERRYKASYIAGLTKVPAIIIDLNDNESAEVAIVENLQREDLSPIEEARSYKKLLDRGYLTQDQLASRMGKTQATISNKLRLLNLDEKVQDALLNNKISERHARSLLRFPNKEDQVNMLEEIISKRLNVRLTEEAITNKLNGKNNENETNDISTFEPKEIEYDKELPDFDKIVKIDGNGDLSLINDNEIVSENKEPVEDITINPIPFIRPVLEDSNSSDNLIKPIATLPKEESLPIQTPISKDIKNVNEKINEAVNSIRDLGFNVKIEEYDFEDLYQFVIKVDKK